MRSFLFFLIIAAGSCYAATPWEHTSAAMNYRPYPIGSDATRDTVEVPAGYQLFSLQHYGRHGSRFHTDYKRQDNMTELLRSNRRTAMGDSLLLDITERRNAMDRKLGDLTRLGAEQHRGIACRMVKSAPQLFRPDTRLNAISSFTVRCILSMANAVAQIRNDVPGIKADMDASKADVCITRNERGDADAITRGQYAQVLREYRGANGSGIGWIDRLLMPGYAPMTQQHVDSLADCLHDIMANATSERILMSERNVFTPAEIEAIHRRLNAEWFMYAGNYSPFGGKRMAYAADLLKDIINKAAAAVGDSLPHVDLRFGHESMLLPLLVLMDIDGYGREYGTLSKIDGHWDAGNAFPMAANLQIYFARPIHGDGPIMVKAFLNEQPATLPLPARTDGWSDWEDLLNYYSTRLAAIEN